MNSPDFHESNGGGTEVCCDFQVDLSCLVDGELDQKAAARAMLHLEDCGSCKSFFEETRKQVRLHRDLDDPERLFARIATLTGTEFAQEVEDLDLVHRLATIFYQLGKAYTLAAIDPDFRQTIFEEAVPVDVTKTQGRGFVDGVLMRSDKDEPADGPAAGGIGARVDWREARHMLNGRLERIADPLKKGRRLLEEAIGVDPSHEEARLYLAFLEDHEGRPLRSAEGYREVFDTGVNPVNRAHAAIQLGRLYWDEQNYKKALTLWRWVVVSGLADSDERFWFVRLNVGLGYAVRHQTDRAVDYFQALVTRFPGRAADAARVLAEAPELREPIASQPGFAEALIERCPELFPAPTSQADSQ